MKNPYTIDRLLQKADFLGMYTIRSEANLSGYIYNDNERYPGCHDECTRYKAAKAEYDRQKQVVSKKRIHEGEVVDFFKVSCCRKRGR